MTTRLAMAVALLLVLLAQAWGVVSAWRDDPLRSLAFNGEKETQAAIMPEGQQSMQPTPPAVPPDLNQGYIFNAERRLDAGNGKSGQEAQNAEKLAMGKVYYSGSIIIGSNPKALLSLEGHPDSSGGVIQKQGFLRVMVGDTVNGYKVTEILPEKIIFSRDGQQITKLLYDKVKNRGQGQTLRSNNEQIGGIPFSAPAPPVLKAPGQNAPSIFVPSPPASAAEVAGPPQVSSSLPPQPPPNGEELRQRPLRPRKPRPFRWPSR